MAACLVSCHRGQSPADATTADQRVTLRYWDFPHLPEVQRHIERTITAFEAKHPNVHIDYSQLPWQDGQQKVFFSVASGNMPDICGQVNVSPMFIQQGVLEPLDDLVPAKIWDDMHPAYRDAIRYRGRAMAMPWYKACYVALLNVDVFEKFGVPLPTNGRWTYDEFTSAARAMTQRDAATGRQYYGLVTNVGPAEYEAYSIIANAGGRIILREMVNGEERLRSGLLEPPFRRGVQRLVDLEYDLRVALPGMGSMTQEQSWSAWRDGRNVGVTFQGGWCITALQRFNDELATANARKVAAGRASEAQPPLRWSIAAPPHDAGTTPVLASSGLGTYVIFKQKSDAKRRLAAEFILDLTTGPGQQILKAENTYPSLRSTGNLWADDPMLGPVFELFPGGVMTPLVPGGERIDRVLQTEIQRTLLRNPATGRPQSTVEASLQAAESKVAAILERAARRSPEPAD